MIRFPSVLSRPDPRFKFGIRKYNQEDIIQKFAKAAQRAVLANFLFYLRHLNFDVELVLVDRITLNRKCDTWLLHLRLSFLSGIERLF